MRHWKNPWETARDVLLEDIIVLVSRYNNHPRPEERAEVLRRWLAQHEKLDAYIIPAPSGWHSLGARYGNGEAEYVSFTADAGPELEALLAKSTSAR